jgi:YggT family protein
MEAETSTGKRLLKSMSPRVVLSQAEGYPVVIKQSCTSA